MGRATEWMQAIVGESSANAMRKGKNEHPTEDMSASDVLSKLLLVNFSPVTCLREGRWNLASKLATNQCFLYIPWGLFSN